MKEEEFTITIYSENVTGILAKADRCLKSILLRFYWNCASRNCTL